MCGRYTLYEVDEVAERFDVETPDDLTPNWNAAPTQTMPVITSDGLTMMRWGLIPKWAKDEKIGYKMINARSETVFEKPMWKGLITTKKCLIPSNGFYEWQKRQDGKQPFLIQLDDAGLFAFAGLWETWKHEGKEWNTYTILTTTPNKEMEGIHDRMPVILHKDDEQHWLNADRPDDIEPLLRPLDDGLLKTFEVSKDVNVVKNNVDTLILSVNSK